MKAAIILTIAAIFAIFAVAILIASCQRAVEDELEPTSQYEYPNPQGDYAPQEETVPEETVQYEELPPTGGVKLYG